jgi:hypothetical protein
VLFSTRLLTVERPRDLGGSFTAVERASAGGRRLRLTNGTAVTLRGAYVYRRGYFHWIGDLGPGRAAEVDPARGRARPEGTLPESGSASQLIENQRFRASFRALWERAAETLVSGEARRDGWLVGECEGYRGGLEVAQVPHSNRTALLLLRLQEPLAGGGRP